MILLVPILVFGAFLVICTLMTVGEPLNPTRPLVSYDQAREYAHRLQKLIACKTVSREEGHEDAAFRELRSVMQELFPRVHREARIQTFGDDCWVYFLPGKNTEKNILLMAHHDVAPAEGNWKYPPFSGEIADGKLWGRGAVDNKTNLFAMFSALEELLAEGLLPECNVWIASSHNKAVEGDGIALAAAYFRQQGITFDLVLDQGCAVVDAPISAMTCSKCAMIAFQEKGFLRMVLTAEAGYGHASTVRSTPTERMADFISEFRREGLFIRRMTPELETMLKAVAPYTAFSLKFKLANLWLFKSLLVKQLPNISREAAELLGTTCSFNDLVTEENGRRCTARIVLRCMDSEDLKTDLTHLRTLATKYGIRVQMTGESGFTQSSNAKSPALEKVSQCIREVFPDVPVIPYVLSETTDARYFADLSDCVLRFSPLRVSAQQMASVQASDENVDIASIGIAVIFYRHVLERGASGKYHEDMDEDLPEEEPDEILPDSDDDFAAFTGEDSLNLTEDFLLEEPDDYLPEELGEDPLLEEMLDFGISEAPKDVYAEEDFLLEDNFLESVSGDPLEEFSDIDLNTYANWEELI